MADDSVRSEGASSTVRRPVRKQSAEIEAGASTGSVTRAQVAAAKLRMTTDRRLGKATPDWIREIADAS